MKIWVLSDIHVELSGGWDLPEVSARPPYDVLVVAGDLMPRMERGVVWLRERIQDRPVIYLPGNHEGYGNDIDETFRKAKQAAEGTNVFVMNDEVTEIDGVKFVASTLWTDFALFGSPEIAMSIARESMNDYRRVRIENYARRLHPKDTLSRHIRSRRFIEAELERSFAGPRIVLTHHVPYRSGLARGHEDDLISAAYVSDLADTIQRFEPDVWIFGHVHESRRDVLHRTRMISNPKGYGPRLAGGFWENGAFDPAFTIDVPSENRT